MRSTEWYAPYVYGGDTALLDTTTLTNGLHTLAARANYASSTATVSITVTVANGAPSPTPTPTPPPGGCPASLQTAINNTANGGTLNITGCSYSGGVSIGKPMTLVGGIVSGGNPVIRIAADDVTLSGTEVKNGSAGLQHGNIENNGYDAMTLDAVWVHDSSGSCFHVDNSAGHVIRDSLFERCGQQAYSISSCSDVMFTGNVVRDNNTDGIDPFWEAGGGKIARSDHVTFDDNDVHDNAGPGIWYDIYNTNSVITNNRVWGNQLSGIFYEISSSATISGNAVWENAWGDGRGWGWGGGILVSSSNSTHVTGNTVAWSPVGISFIDQNRDKPGPAHDLVGTGNVIAVSSGHTTIGKYSDYSGSTLSSDPTNVISPNTIVAAGSSLLTDAGVPAYPVSGH